MPAWLDNAVFYQIYPQSFYDTNGDGIGDLEGIIQKLDYIGWLGCDAVWLNPCFASPFYDAGYDVSDYRQVAPRYGNNEDMRRLIAEAHRRGIRVLLDMVPGHTSLEHEWFQKSARGEAGLAGRYIWAGGWDNFEGIEGVRGGISGYFQRGCCAVNFFSCQPALNYGFAAPDPDKPWQIPPGAPDALATRDALTDAMRFWLSMGCDGFRVDMAGSLVKGDGGPAATAALWQDVLGRLRGEFPEAVWVSEWSNPALSAVAGFDMDFLLPFGTLPYMRLFREQPYFARRGSGGSGGMDAFVAGYERLLKTVASHGPHGSQGSHGPHGSMICIPSGNHDTPRISRRLDDNELRLSFAFLLSIPGAPFLYYGDEIAMRYLEGVDSVEGGYERTGSRSPMQWDATGNAGFSSAAPEKLYIPLDPDPNRPTVEAQMSTRHSLLREVRALIALRRKYKELQNREGIEFAADGADCGPLAYWRGQGEGRIFVAINPASQPAEVPLAGWEDARVLHRIGAPCVVEGGSLKLAPGSCAFLRRGCALAGEGWDAEDDGWDAGDG